MILYYIISYCIILYYIISYQIQVVEHNSQSFRCPESTVVMCEGLQIHVMPSNLFAEAFGQAQMKTMRAKIGFTSIYFVEINHQWNDFEYWLSAVYASKKARSAF